MTSEVKKSIRAATGVLACLGAMSFGALWRDRLEMGNSPRGNVSLGDLVASNSAHPELPESKFFQDILQLLERKYVDPITDETKLADGAVRGMVASLGDPNSLFMDRDQFRVYSDARIGKYEGIGVALVLTRDKPHVKVQVSGGDESADAGYRLPRLMVAAVVPGSSADKAGLRPGDWAEFVDDHWIPNSEALDRFKVLTDQVKDQKASPAEWLKMRKLLQDESEKHILPIRARDRLMMGKSGEIRSQWVRDGKPIVLTLKRGEWTMPGFEVQKDGSIRLTFVAGSAQFLAEALRSKKEAVLDLRNNVDGDFDSMLACLRTVAPNGDYGYLVTHKDEKPSPLSVQDGSKERLRLTLRVDRTTRGAAEIFALALSSRGIAKLDGSETAGDRFVTHWYALPDGAGYSLVTGEYRTHAPSGVVAKADTNPNSLTNRVGQKLYGSGPVVDGGKR